MSIFSSPIPLQRRPSEDQPHRWSERIPLLLRFLLRQTPLRRLSQSLIIILMLISPLSFSTDKISNFTYECPVSRGCSIKERRCTGIIYRSPHPRQQAGTIVSAAHDLPVPLHPPRIRISCETHSRAPPA